MSGDRSIKVGLFLLSTNLSTLPLVLVQAVTPLNLIDMVGAKHNQLLKKLGRPLLYTVKSDKLRVIGLQLKVELKILSLHWITIIRTF